MADDKVRILAAMKKVWGERLTTVFVRQGHYANDRTDVQRYPPADVEIVRVAQLLDLDSEFALNPAATAFPSEGEAGG